MSYERQGVPRALMANPDGTKRGPSGRILCKWCGTETKPPRRVWCSSVCEQEFVIRVSWTAARRAVRKRDKGRCALCGLDCAKFKRQLWSMRVERGHEWFKVVVRVLGIASYFSGSLWHADHVKPVVEGGGMCGLDNLRTLCRWCHRGETRKLRQRLKAAKRQITCPSPSMSPPPSEPSRPKHSRSTVKTRSKASGESRLRKR